MKTYFLDLETTGLNVDKDKIIEIAIVNMDDVNDQLHYYVNPSMSLPPAITQITGIDDAKLAGQPTFDMIAKEVFDKLSSAECLGGHNILNYDLPLLSNELSRCGLVLSNNFKIIDTLLIERNRLSHRLAPTYKRYYGKDFDCWHGATADTIASIDIAKAQMKSGTDDMYSPIGVDICGRVAMHDGQLVWKFGKYLNKPVVENVQYANWVLSQDFPATTKRAILNELNKQQHA